MTDWTVRRRFHYYKISFTGPGFLGSVFLYCEPGWSWAVFATSGRGLMSDFRRDCSVCGGPTVYLVCIRVCIPGVQWD